jgi:hypothetical protein
MAEEHGRAALAETWCFGPAWWRTKIAETASKEPGRHGRTLILPRPFLFIITENPYRDNK